MEMVRAAFYEEGQCVAVLESPSLEAVRRGLLWGRWYLGQAEAECVGTLVWLRRERHVVRIAQQHAVSDGLYVDSGLSPPWCRYAVGAPKKNSQRGAHFRKGGSGYQGWEHQRTCWR